MSEFVLFTDNTCDMPRSFYEENGIEVLTLSCLMDGKRYTYDDSMPEQEFYEKLRSGSMPTTSQVNPQEAAERFRPYAEKGMDILYIAFSSGLSGSCNSARLAAEMLAEDNLPGRIVVVDSLCASMGEGLLVYYAVQLKKEGKTLDEVAAWLEENKLHLCHNFTVDDLFHLHRGGRVSKATAILGTMIGVKPVLHVDNEGHLINIGKARGRKKSLIALVDNMEKQIKEYEGENKIVFISHGDSEEDARFVENLVRTRFGIESFVTNYIGPTIGAHSGPGTIALFFMGAYR